MHYDERFEKICKKSEEFESQRAYEHQSIYQLPLVTSGLGSWGAGDCAKIHGVKPPQVANLS